jgi:hypothetical protein
MKEHLEKRLSSEFQPNRTNIERVMAKTVFTCQILTNSNQNFFLWDQNGKHRSHMKEVLFLHLGSEFRVNRANGEDFPAKKRNFATLTYHNFGQRIFFFFPDTPQT